MQRQSPGDALEHLRGKQGECGIHLKGTVDSMQMIGNEIGKATLYENTPAMCKSILPQWEGALHLVGRHGLTYSRLYMHREHYGKALIVDQKF